MTKFPCFRLRVVVLVSFLMATPPHDDRSDHQSAVALSGPHAFVRSSMKSVIKALSGRRQSPSPTFQRTSVEVVGGAERTDQDVNPEQSLLATDESDGLPLSEPEVRSDLSDSGINDRAYLKVSKIRSLHGNEPEQENLGEDSPGVRESRYFGNLPDLQSSKLDFRLSGAVFGGGLGRLASPHSPKTPSFPPGKRYEEEKESRGTRGERL